MMRALAKADGKETGIKKADWYENFKRWATSLREAGFSANLA